MPARNVKRVSKTRSKTKVKRPKQGSPLVERVVVPETVETMHAPAIAPVMESVIPAAIPPVPGAGGRVVLGASCTIHEAPALRAHLLEQAALPGPYEIDGSGVQHIDTACLQLVVAFALDCLERSIHYVWTGRSAVLDEAIRILGVGALLESPGAASYSPGGK
jgi:anti-anti-sigma regulatory factor